jgi:hypothetical protein
MYLRIALLSLLLISNPEVTSGFGNRMLKEIEQNVDLIELNHYYDERGENAYDQIIFYRWSPDYRRYDVMAWLLADAMNKLPAKDFNREEYVVRWEDKGYQVHRVIRSKAFRETWSNQDPERAHKKLMDESLRIGFARKLEWK